MALVIVAAIASSACVAGPAPGRPQLRVIQGGSGVPATSAPSVSPAPEPPIGVIMSGRVVLGCDYGARCAYFARLSPVSPERPDPTVAPATTVTLQGVDGPTRGFGPTARSGRPGDQEPAYTARLVAGTWHIDAWTTLVGQAPPRIATRGERASCGMDFIVKPGDSLSFRVASLATGCSIRIAGAAIP